MPYEPVRRTGAGGWTTILGLALALVAAGSFIAFSLIARDATGPILNEAVVAVTPASTAPVLTLAQPDGRTGRGDGGDQVRAASNGRDLVLGTRFFNGPAGGTKTSTGGGATDCTTRCGGTNSPDLDHDSTPTPTRPEPTTDKDKGKGNGGNGSADSAGPSPNGKAKGHIKAKGKGHDKHPED